MIQALIVDDESLVRKGMRLLFPWEKFGVEIAGEAATGEKAMEFMRTHAVQLLMTDITMPGMSGLELLKLVGELNPPPKVVILTCHQDFDYIQEALRLGAVDYIVKTQLEELDLDQTMERILRVVRQELPGSVPAQAKAKNESARKAAARLAENVQWVMDDAAFAALADAVAELEVGGASGPGASSLLAAAMERWRRSFPMFAWERQSGPPDEEAGAWLRTLRGELAAWLRGSAYSEDVIKAIVKAVDLIQEQPGLHRKQSEISRSVNLSKSYFSTSFRDITRLTFTHFLQAASLQAAKELLLATNHPVYWIAERCGFTDQRYFSKLFKEQTGLLPSEYRQRHTERSRNESESERG
ncbi:response regulator transcription factor [Paenibacillus sacheonensis]|uniref:Response regulator n=1 Tax=Paenibacillus sacheonensis TaxID=742054 RepID=A0A7X5BYY6_9BACL|nr:response regulator [Paenibacillus sacheonensis]MBM7565074.1 two-component system response regulator YesN [Paenibacillus sacheonensis]NBC70142.1 response regulator [Paenibacillus sacheonensis]